MVLKKECYSKGIRVQKTVMQTGRRENPLRLLTIVIPARDEEGCINSTVKELHLELRRHQIPHEIIAVDDGSSDQTWEILQETGREIEELLPVQNQGLH